MKTLLKFKVFRWIVENAQSLFFILCTLIIIVSLANIFTDWPISFMIIFCLISLAIAIFLFAIATICYLVKNDRDIAKNNHFMTYKEFINWTNDRAADGKWSLVLCSMCIEVRKAVEKVPSYYHERAWKQILDNTTLKSMILAEWQTSTHGQTSRPDRDI